MARVGDRWALLLVHALLDGPRRFNDLRTTCAGIAPNVLTQRLRHLEREGVVVARPYSAAPAPVRLRAHRRRAGSWPAPSGCWPSGARAGPRRRRRAPSATQACGTAMEARWYCPTCARRVDEDRRRRNPLPLTAAAEHRASLGGTQPTTTAVRFQRSLGLSADAVVALHTLFIVFLLAGGFLAWWWPAAIPVHILAVVVSTAIYLGGYDCPLTHLEKHLRTLAGEAVYPEGFIDHYMVRPVHAAGMTPALGLGLVVLVLGATLVAYGHHFV